MLCVGAGVGSGAGAGAKGMMDRGDICDLCVC
jgi:hypothetical protein